MLRLRDLVPPLLRPAARSALHAAYRRRLAAEWWVRDRLERAAQLPPARLRFRVGESSDPTVFSEVGHQAAANLALCLETAGRSLSHTTDGLDFGCGCGRTLAWLARQSPNVRWHGTDVDAEAIAWCRAHVPGAFAVNARRPPLPFPDARFDLVFGVSVFTHLDEDDQRAWVPELHRVLMQGGALVLSFHSERVWRATAESADVERGGFVFRRSAKLRGIVPDWYHTAFQNRSRIEDLLRTRFADARFVEHGFGDQDAVVAIKS